MSWKNNLRKIGYYYTFNGLMYNQFIMDVVLLLLAL